MLYEVITRMRQGVLERMIDNVLLTQAIQDAKLRVGDEQVKQAILAMPVITSYSIHYTKLYEAFSASFPELMAPGKNSCMIVSLRLSSSTR